MNDNEFKNDKIMSNENESITKLQSQPTLGEVLQIVDDNFNVNNENLKLLLGPLASKPVIIISFVGESKIGKSFLLNILLRHLKKIDEHIWFTEQDAIHKNGFKSTGDSESCTNGIWVWSEPLYADGIKYPIVLMDTQGTFGDNTDFKRSTAIFGFSALASSITVYNLNGRINVNDVRNLDIFAKMADLCSGGEKPFQKFMFLCRDWKFRDYEFGFKGGYNHANDFLRKEVEEKEAKGRLLKSFGTPLGFLMPYPGEKVSYGTVQSFSDIGLGFRTQLKEFINSFFTEEYLQPMRLKRVVTNGAELLRYLEAIVTLLSAETEITPLSLSEVHDKLAITDASNMYKEKLSFFEKQDSQQYYLEYSIHSVFETIKGYLENPKRFAADLKIDVLTELESKVQEINFDERMKNEAQVKRLVAETEDVYKEEIKKYIPEFRKMTNVEILGAHNRGLLAAFDYFFRDDGKRFEVRNEDVTTLSQHISVAFTELWDNIQTKQKFQEAKVKNAFADAVKSELDDYRRNMNTLCDRENDPTEILKKHHSLVQAICAKYEESFKHEDIKVVKQKVMKLRETLGNEYEKICSNIKSKRLHEEQLKSQQLQSRNATLQAELTDKSEKISNLKSDNKYIKDKLESKDSEITNLNLEKHKLKNKTEFQDVAISNLTSEREKKDKQLSQYNSKVLELSSKSTKLEKDLEWSELARERAENRSGCPLS